MRRVKIAELLKASATATDRASFGSFFAERPVASTRTLDANVAGTSSTVSPGSIRNETSRNTQWSST